MRSNFVRFCRTWLLPLLGVTILFGGLTGAGLAPTSATFQVIPPVTVSGGSLSNVSINATTNAWAVGNGSGSSGFSQALILPLFKKTVQG